MQSLSRCTNPARPLHAPLHAPCTPPARPPHDPCTPPARPLHAPLQARALELWMQVPIVHACSVLPLMEEADYQVRVREEG